MQIIELKNGSFDKEVIKDLLEKKICLIQLFAYNIIIYFIKFKKYIIFV